MARRGIRARRSVQIAVAVLSLAACTKADSSAPAAAQATPGPAPAAPAAQPAPQEQAPVVNADAKTLAAYQAALKDYVALHQKHESALPRLPTAATPQQIDANQRNLGKLIAASRATAKHGDVFTPDMQALVRRMLVHAFDTPEGKLMKGSIMDENPVGLKLAVNGRYPDEVPLSTMPPSVLKALPPLPEEMEYRFIGHRLILLDVHSHLVVDYIENALPKNP